MNLKFIQLFILILLTKCQIADPNYKQKSFKIEDYTGFISRDFFQVVVEVPLELSDKPILQQRETCKLQSRQKRDELTLPILRKIASSNQKKFIEFSKSKTQEDLPSFEKKGGFNKKEDLEGEFAWFFNHMFLYKEDYTQKDKCKFIYRNISRDLYARVENTKLIYPESKEIQTNPQIQMPQPIYLPVIPTGGNVR